MKADHERRRKLRAREQAPGILIAPGAFDALSGRIVERAGFDAAFFTGGGLSRSSGFPEIGLVTMTEVLNRVGRMVESMSIPLIVDADTGYGNAINAIRTVQEFERLGVAAIQFEDQVTPKRGGHWSGKQVVPKDEMVKKLRAAVETREDPDLVLVARVDAIAVEGFERAMDRALAYRDAGADVLFVEAPTTMEEVAAVPQRLAGTPCLLNRVPRGGKTPLLSAPDAERLGYKIVIFPADPQLAAIHAMKGLLAHLKEKGTVDGYPAIPMPERDEIVGWDAWRAREERYL